MCFLSGRAPGRHACQGDALPGDALPPAPSQIASAPRTLALADIEGTPRPAGSRRVGLSETPRSPGGACRATRCIVGELTHIAFRSSRGKDRVDCYLLLESG